MNTATRFWFCVVLSAGSSIVATHYPAQKKPSAVSDVQQPSVSFAHEVRPDTVYAEDSLRIWPKVNPVATSLPQYSATATRSLDAAARPDRSPVPLLTLRGISSWGSNRVAFVQSMTNGETRVVHVGDSLDNMTVVAIDDHRLTLRAGPKTTSLEMGIEPVLASTAASADFGDTVEEVLPVSERAPTADSVANETEAADVASRVSMGIVVANPP